jgi:hypothetical protein
MKRILPILLILFLTGCQKMEAGEYGVVFSALPTFLGGGVQNKVIEPGEVKFLFPWSSVYHLKSTDRSISWGAIGNGSNKSIEDYVETRALDGNEVGLAITIQYAIDKEKAPIVIQRVGIEPEAVDQLVRAVAQADIRTHMNILRTRDFFSPSERQDAVNQVKVALQNRLEPDGIIIRDVIYNDHRFERRIDENTMDDSYQQQIDRTQQTAQETEQEEKKIATVVEQKKREFNEAQARVNRQLEQIEGNKTQAEFRGNSYLEAKKNEAEQIRTIGLAAVEGLEKQVEALKGPGGRALLKIEIVKSLLLSDPKFISLGSKGPGGMQVERLDTNELINQFGIMHALEPKK